MERYGAMNMLQSPNLRQAIKDANESGRCLLGSVLGIPSVANAKILAAMPDTDFVWVDAEHTPYSPTLLSEVVHTLKFYSHGKTIPMVRVPNHSHEWIAWALDAGAGGIVLPHTETVEQVQAAIAAARFPPHGHRSFPPFVVIFGLQDTAPEGKTWLDVASEHCAVIPQIESLKGVENLEAIMQVPGVDAIMVGPGDLMLDIGVGKEAEIAAAHARIEALAKKYNMPLVSAAFEHQVEEKYKKGYRMLATAMDVWILSAGVQKNIASAREVCEKARREIQGEENGGANGHANGSANGHANGHGNGHANGEADGAANGAAAAPAAVEAQQ
ncbi:putative hpcH/HpaI aldolase/citrate lyase family protein [Lyophyllum shimeji]|uniref:HpcH/HpaI aldolase/citrate lyase family protein n=1 Tax=Lyophyllum shimeji TaxID=47721 RepID=A0A9P3PPQ2_LYOSH|nr:putative hpcH/HpaI aldolase/citrate lyase family protein [Lyophyllum shimeji]